MGAPELAVALFLMGGVFTVLWWLLTKKDAKQEEAIKDLYIKHQEDAGKLTALELQIAKNHFEKTEVTKMFDNFKLYLDEKFGELKTSINEVHRRDL